jgi:protein transport protein SEC24
MAGDVGVQNDQVDVVDFGTTGIVRCSRCRTYINPFVSWTDSGRRWRCCICGVLNDVPNSYFSHLDQNGQRRDKGSRPELSRCSVEFIAPAEYMVRPPQPPAYFFAIDVSQAAAASGMLASCVRAIKDSLASLPGLPRTLIGFMTFDTSIHFYNLKSTLKAPQMLVISDVNDLILPSPEDLLVNLQESRAVVEALLDSLPSMFQSNSAVGSCTGPALTAAKRVIQHIGGKLCLFQTCLPNIGEGTLKPRDNPRLLGTDKEYTLLVADDAWYKNNAIDFSRLQIAVDTFLFANQYTDVATLSVLSKVTAGTSYYYPGFFAPRDGNKFESELRHCLTRATGFEAVMRVRATRGLRIANFHGNLFVRGSDLLALPNVTSDSTFAFDLAYDEPILAASVVTVQSALLYTTSSGERRIRVHTMILPVTDSVTAMLETVDIDTAVNVTAKQAIEIASKTGLESARAKVHQACIDVLRAARSAPMGGYGMAPQQQQQLPAIPASLQLLPLYSMSLQKNVALRGGVDVRVDDRSFYMQLLCNMDIAESRVFVYPRMFSIHDMSLDAGTPSDNADEGVPTAGPKQVRLPAILNLSYERLNSEGIFLLENGYEMFLWVGRSVNPSIINTLFGVTSLEGVDVSSLRIEAESSDFSYRLDEVVQALRSERPERYMQLHIIREGDGYGEAYFSRYLVEDK